jgi:hypothetical protein
MVQPPDVRAAARRVIQQEPEAALLLAMLGLDDSDPPAGLCRRCGGHLPADGRKACRKVACIAAARAEREQAEKSDLPQSDGSGVPSGV